MSEEIELKLTVLPRHRAKIGASRFVPGHAETQDLHATYFDTPDHALKDAGISLRIRQKGQQLLQTIKLRDAAAGLFSRAEWEQPVESDAAPVLDDAKPVRKALNGKMKDIVPAFDVDVTRRRWTVDGDAAQIEVAIDHGLAKAEARETMIDEIELELKDGPPGALFALARRIDAIAPVRLSVESKADRGYRLLDKARPAFKAEALGLRKELTTAELFRIIGHSCIRHYRMNEVLLLDAPVPEAVHQARVAIRRLRSAFKAFGKGLDGPEVEAFKRELKWLGHVLGEARDLDVLWLKAEDGALKDRLGEARAAAYARLGRALALKRTRYVMLDLTEWLTLGDFAQGKAWQRRPAAFAARALGRQHGKIRKAGYHLGAQDDEHRHEVRKQAKALRYTAEFFAPLFDDKGERKARKHFFGAMETLQDEMGALNDLVTAPMLLERLKIADLPGADQLAGRGDKDALKAKADRAFKRFVKVERFW